MPRLLQSASLTALVLSLLHTILERRLDPARWARHGLTLSKRLHRLHDSENSSLFQRPITLTESTAGEVNRVKRQGPPLGI